MTGSSAQQDASVEQVRLGVVRVLASDAPSGMHAFLVCDCTALSEEIF